MNIANAKTLSKLLTMWIIFEKLKMAVNRLLGKTSKRSAYPAIRVKPRPNELIVVSRCEYRGGHAMEGIDVDIRFGRSVTAPAATALTIDLLCANLVTWIRAVEHNTGERYYKAVKDNLDKWYVEESDHEPEIEFNL